jgi:hypothetical protein
MEYARAIVRPSGYPTANTPVEDLGQKLTEGLVDIGRAAYEAAGDDHIIRTGPNRGESQAKTEFLRGLKKLGSGVSTAAGNPLAPAYRIGERAYDAATADVDQKRYEELKRSRPR